MAEFTCGLLNAQPMGFYSPATIVGDAQRHGVEIRPIDVNVSEWDCTIEGRAVRMGLRWVKGLAIVDGERIVAARTSRSFATVEEFARRARLEGKAYASLAEAGALGSLAPVAPRRSAAPLDDRTEAPPAASLGRRDALWQVSGWARRQEDALALGGDVDTVAFPALDRLDEIFWDYRASDHSTRGHPLGPMRRHLASRGWPDARTVARMRDGQRVEYVGIVICRQQPGTASGVVFMTMEDETGFVNLVVWAQVFADNALVVRTSSLLGVAGRLQVQEGIVHLIADRFFVPDLPRDVVKPASRDFH